MRLLRTLVIIPILLLCYCRLSAQPETKIPDPGKYNISHDPVLYTVGYAHLDTQWRWDYPETINQYIKATMEDNFRYFEKYKEYVFTFTGARRYKMMKEYYPDQYEKLKKYISKGRWFVGGSSVDECDANIPSPESILRQVLYGNNYFRSEYGKERVDFLLPDCFGFQAHIPSILAHCGPGTRALMPAGSATRLRTPEVTELELSLLSLATLGDSPGGAGFSPPQRGPRASAPPTVTVLCEPQ